jgi:hypothetical protein
VCELPKLEELILWGNLFKDKEYYYQKVFEMARGISMINFRKDGTREVDEAAVLN